LKADTVVTKVLHKVTHAASGSSKNEEEAIDSEPKLTDEATGDASTRSPDMSTGDKSNLKSKTSAAMSATKKVCMAGPFTLLPPSFTDTYCDAHS
jgi:hypothetical protein